MRKASGHIHSFTRYAADNIANSTERAKHNRDMEDTEMRCRRLAYILGRQERRGKEMIETESESPIKKIIDDFCKGKYVVDLNLFPYCIKIEKIISSYDERTYYNFHFTIFLPQEDKKLRFEISKTGSCGFYEDSPLEEIIKLYDDSIKFLRDMALLQKIIEKEGIK
jgi:hypothetical protein